MLCLACMSGCLSSTYYIAAWMPIYTYIHISWLQCESYQSVKENSTDISGQKKERLGFVYPCMSFLKPE